jgi:hypothetical protein
MIPIRPPIVSDVDREWAMAQCPSWARRGDDEDEELPEIVDPGDWLDVPKKFERKPPNWSTFVWEQIESFERFFAGQGKSSAEWSTLWRKSWWPKANPNIRFPGMAPKEFHPFFRKGSKEYTRAWELGTDYERRMWDLTHVAQFKPDDPRLKKIQLPEPKLTETTKRITGETA